MNINRLVTIKDIILSPEDLNNYIFNITNTVLSGLTSETIYKMSLDDELHHYLRGAIEQSLKSLVGMQIPIYQEDQTQFNPAKKDTVNINFKNDVSRKFESKHFGNGIIKTRSSERVKK